VASPPRSCGDARKLGVGPQARTCQAQPHPSHPSAGKLWRLKEAGLWNLEPTGYFEEGRYLSFTPPKVPHPLPPAAIEPYAECVARQQRAEASAMYDGWWAPSQPAPCVKPIPLYLDKNSDQGMTISEARTVAPRLQVYLAASRYSHCPARRTHAARTPHARRTHAARTPHARRRRISRWPRARRTHAARTPHARRTHAARTPHARRTHAARTPHARRTHAAGASQDGRALPRGSARRHGGCVATQPDIRLPDVRVHV
jgi:hypothetical protein